MFSLFQKGIFRKPVEDSATFAMGIAGRLRQIIHKRSIEDAQAEIRRNIRSADEFRFAIEAHKCLQNASKIPPQPIKQLSGLDYLS
jgi:hypothetical protein